MPNGNTTSQSVDVLGQRVSTLEGTVGDINRKIDLIASKLDGSGRANWPVILAFAGMMISAAAGLYIFVFTPINQMLAVQSAGQAKILEKIDDNREKDRDKYAAKDEVEYRFLISGKRRDEQFSDIVKRLDKNEEIARLANDKIVPRGENEEHWRSTDRDILNLQRQIDKLADSQGQTYTARDEIKRLGDQVQDLIADKFKSR